MLHRSSSSDPEIVSKIMASLDLDYNPVVSALAARVEPVWVQELYNKLLSFDACLALLHGTNIRQSSVNSASRGCGRGCSSPPCGRRNSPRAAQVGRGVGGSQRWCRPWPSSAARPYGGCRRWRERPQCAPATEKGGRSSGV